MAFELGKDCTQYILGSILSHRYTFIAKKTAHEGAIRGAYDLLLAMWPHISTSYGMAGTLSIFASAETARWGK